MSSRVGSDDYGGSDEEGGYLSASSSEGRSSVGMISPPSSSVRSPTPDAADVSESEIERAGNSEFDDNAPEESASKGNSPGSSVTAQALVTEYCEGEAEASTPRLGAISAELAKEVRHVDDPESPFGCPHCEKAYPSKKSLSRHARDSVCARSRRESMKPPKPKKPQPDLPRMQIPQPKEQNPLKRPGQQSAETSPDGVNKKQRRVETRNGDDIEDNEAEETEEESMAEDTGLDLPSASHGQVEQAPRALLPSIFSAQESDNISLGEAADTPSGHPDTDSDLSSQELMQLAACAGMPFETYHPIPKYDQSFEDMAYTKQQSQVHDFALRSQWGEDQDGFPANPGRIRRGAGTGQPQRSAMTGSDVLAKIAADRRIRNSPFPSGSEVRCTSGVSAASGRPFRTPSTQPAPIDYAYDYIPGVKNGSAHIGLGISAAQSEAVMRPMSAQPMNPFNGPLTPKVTLIIRSDEKSSNGNFVSTLITLPRNQAFGPVWHEYCNRRNTRFGVDFEFVYAYWGPTLDGGAFKQIRIRLEPNMTPDDVKNANFPYMRLRDNDMIYCTKATPIKSKPTYAVKVEAANQQFNAPQSFNGADERIKTVVMRHNRAMAAKDSTIQDLKSKIGDLQKFNIRLSQQIEALRANQGSSFSYSFDNVRPRFGEPNDQPPSAFVKKCEASRDDD